jgi:hypothetical protein
MISRLDIIFSIAKLVQFSQNLNSEHLVAVNQIIVYLNKIKHLVIEYLNRIAKILSCISDATFVNDDLTRKNFNDYLFKLYEILLIEES